MKGGHFFPEEKPDETALIVKQFLTSHGIGARGETPVLPVYGDE
jgi:hypothetical protein